VGTPFKEEFLHGTGMPPQRRWYWGVAIAALLAAAALLYFWPLPGDRKQPGADTTVVVEETQPLPLQPAPPVATAPQPADADPGASGTAPAANPMPPAAAPDAAPQHTPTTAQAPQSGTAPAAAPPPDAATAPGSAAAAASALLHIQASARAWVQVKNAEGRSLLEKNLAAGETATIRDDALPLSVVIGNAAAVQVHVRGQALDLSARQGVARFAVQ